MSVSYLLDIEQLSVLAFYLDLDAFPGLPPLPGLDSQRSREVVQMLEALGMLRPQGGEASVDFGLAFVLAAMAEPALLLRGPRDILCYCSPALGLALCPDCHVKHRYRITPLPDGAELAERVWEAAGGGGTPLLFALWRPAGGWDERLPLTKGELARRIAQIYTARPEPAAHTERTACTERPELSADTEEPGK